ncbi:bifunctional 4-hydroxy-2-oxoglutarate aldolase/2-dehydro-3-deoxy-phosphogluconate aldolase [Algihabitans albus]|uniref:bifunctional 4-hydroxy-2-oxoglutarate aldolase/2-dehydro-3-deoxy-phosphogluconate aldolase n=1 Tax=Algihabitans albus TaxID=2164067 RepID=UPI000E5D340A|nr:bifunctional 4-hydroxy-2-oxoglutarate aldolase/2-dehydro-3-deoxy-phosphogluconate aldolase [Algihabitans albus]
MDAGLERLRGKAIPVVRSESTEQARKLSGWLIQGGLTILEITTTVPGHADLVAELAADSRLLVGTGTVLDAATAQTAVEAGCRFLVSPCLVPEVIAVGQAAGVPVVPGAATPTEVLTAHRAGAAAVKLFPAEQLGGPSFLKAVRSVLPEVLLIPTGGIALERVSDYFAAGAFAVGLGSQLADAREIAADARDQILARAVRLAEGDTP